MHSVSETPRTGFNRTVQKSVKQKIMRFHSLLLCTLFCIATGCDSLAARPKDRDDRGCATYNILDFGAKNDGTTDCAPAFEKIFRRMEGKRQVEIVLPAGSFRISRRIVFDQPQFGGYDYHSGICVRGAGEDATELICDNEDGGLYFNLATNMLTVTVCDLSLVAVKKGLGTAVEFNTADQNPGDHHSRMFQARNLLVRGPHFSNGYFANGIVVKNAWYPMLDNVKITSEYGDSHGKMAAGFALLDCYSPLVDKCYFWGGAEYGLLYRSEIDSEDRDRIRLLFRRAGHRHSGKAVGTNGRVGRTGVPPDRQPHPLQGQRTGPERHRAGIRLRKPVLLLQPGGEQVACRPRQRIVVHIQRHRMRRRERFHRVAQPVRRAGLAEEGVHRHPSQLGQPADRRQYFQHGRHRHSKPVAGQQQVYRKRVYRESDFTKSADGANALIRYVDPNGTLKTLDFE